MLKSVLKYGFYIAVVVLMANLGALADLVLHPEIPYLDEEHLIVGVVSAAVTSVLLSALALYISHLRRSDNEIRRLNEGLELKVAERTRQLLDAQQELVQKEKLATLGQIAGVVGHELRNPLGVMSNAVYFLQAVLTDADDTTREYLGIIKEEITRAEQIIAELLDSVRTKPPHPENIAVGDLFPACMEKCTIPGNIEVRTACCDNPYKICADPQQMTQVFVNLISNAVDAMPDGGTLNIDVQEGTDAEWVRVSVRDTGTGIAPENLDRLFQPLYSTKARGIGLGLAVVKNLTEANGGRVEVESMQGTGTTFTLSLPTAKGGA